LLLENFIAHSLVGKTVSVSFHPPGKRDPPMLAGLLRVFTPPPAWLGHAPLYPPRPPSTTADITTDPIGWQTMPRAKCRASSKPRVLVCRFRPGSVWFRPFASRCHRLPVSTRLPGTNTRPLAGTRISRARWPSQPKQVLPGGTPIPSPGVKGTVSTSTSIGEKPGPGRSPF